MLYFNKMQKYYNPSSWGSFFHAVIFSAACTVCWCYFISSSNFIPVLAISFTLWSKIADTCKFLSVNEKLSNATKLVHRDYVLEKMVFLRNSLNKKNVSKSSVGNNITNIEDILTQMSRCCVTDVEKASLRSHKGNYGNFKMQIDISDGDQLRSVYDGLLKYNQTMKGILEDLE